MTYVTSCIHSLVIIALCSNPVMMLAGERRIDPYSDLGSLNSKLLGLDRSISCIKNNGSAVLSKFLDKSSERVHHGYDLASKIVAENPTQVSAVAATALVLGLMWYKSEAIKAYCKSEKMEQYKQKAVGVRDSAVKTIDNQIAKVPMPFYMVPHGIRQLIAFMFNKMVAMDSEYVAGAFISPVLGYCNSFTPFAALGGVKVGCALAGAFLVRGWMGIDAAQINKNLKKVDTKLDKLKQSVDGGHKKAEKNHKAVLEKIEDLDVKIGKLSQDIKNEIEASGEKLSQKIEGSETRAEQSREVLKKGIEKVNGELVRLINQVEALPSKDQHQQIVDEAMANTIKSFESLIAISIENSDKKTETKLQDVGAQLIEGFNKIDVSQKDQAKQIERLAKEVSLTIDEREKNVQFLTKLASDTTIELTSVKTICTKTQEALASSHQHYKKLLNTQEQRLEKMISEQISSFEGINIKLSLMGNKIDAVDQKTDNQYAALTEKIGVGLNKQEEAFKVYVQQMQITCTNAITFFKEELTKTQEELAREQENTKLLHEKLNAVIEGQGVQREDQRKSDANVSLLRSELKINAESFDVKQSQILEVLDLIVQNKHGANNIPRITLASGQKDDHFALNYPKNKNQIPVFMQSKLSLLETSQFSGTD